MEKLAEFAELVPGLHRYTVKTAAREQIARNILQEPHGKSAVSLLMCIRHLYGVDAFFWEPETIWLSLEKDGLDISVEARDKILGAITLIRHPAFFWDNLVFQRTVQAFNDQLYDPESLQECHPAHMSWAMYEATLIRGLDPDEKDVPEIDEDVQQYMAVCLKRAGFVYPPVYLLPVADNLENMLPAAQKDFIQEVKKSWEHVDKRALRERRFLESPLDLQLARLASCYVYVKDQAEAMANDVLAMEHEHTTHLDLPLTASSTDR